MHGTFAKALSFVLVLGQFVASAASYFPEVSGHANDDEANKQLTSFFNTVIGKTHFPAINGSISDERPDEFLASPAFTIPASKRMHLCVYDTESLDYQVCRALPRDRCVSDDQDMVRCQWMEREGQGWCSPHTESLCEQRLRQIKAPQDAFETLPLSALEIYPPRSKRYEGIEDLDVSYEGHGPSAKVLGNLGGYFAHGIKSLKTLRVTSHGCASFKAGTHSEFAVGFAEAALDSMAGLEERRRVKAIKVIAQGNQLHSFYLTGEGKGELPFLTSDSPLTITLNWTWFGAALPTERVTGYYACRSQSGATAGRRCSESDEKEKLKGRCFATLPPPYTSQNLYESCGNNTLIKFWKLSLELPPLPVQ